ncbi:hypothetical protein F2P81_024851 [Scophthalmus maximus]|uniref:Uncharacterized protein n=1 Tax=Scophthalmus maximus TaxID=52904 RepID=A0A6A4RU15_SCOMX|nr:hypothetical protein F2P81_024851 [Scophthalmus maximus]
MIYPHESPPPTFQQITLFVFHVHDDVSVSIRDRFGSGQFPLMHSTRRVGTCTGLFSNCRKPVDAGEISQRVTTETFCLDSSASDDVPQTPHKKMNSLNSLRLDLWFLLSVWGNVVM